MRGDVLGLQSSVSEVRQRIEYGNSAVLALCSAVSEISRGQGFKGKHTKTLEDFVKTSHLALQGAGGNPHIGVRLCIG
jgi:hypothetical protein